MSGSFTILKALADDFNALNDMSREHGMSYYFYFGPVARAGALVRWKDYLPAAPHYIPTAERRW